MESPFAHELGFLKKLDNAMQDIMTDGKIDAHDIPTLVCLFTDMLTSSTTTTSTNLTMELQSLFDFIMTHYQLFPADGEAALDFKKMFDACVKLVLYKPPTRTTTTRTATTAVVPTTKPEYSRLGFFIRLCSWCTSRKKKKADITKVVQKGDAVVNTVVNAVAQVQDAVGQIQDAVGQVQDAVVDAVGQIQDAVSLGQDAVSLRQDTVLSAVTDGLAVIVEEAEEAIWATAPKALDLPAL